MAPVPPRGPTRHRARLASPGVDGLLALAVPTANGWWAAPHRGELRALIRRMTLENPLWGQRRVQAELTRLGFTVSARTVATYKRRPYDGVPSPSWREFLTRQAKDIWACDFFSVRTIFFQTLDVFFVMRHETRQIVQVRVTRHPTAAWAAQQVLDACGWDRGPCDADESGLCLLLEPFPSVALVGPGGAGELAGGGGARPIKRAVQAEAIAEVDGTQVHEGDRGVEQPGGERAAGRGGVIGTVGAILRKEHRRQGVHVGVGRQVPEAVPTLPGQPLYVPGPGRHPLEQ